MTTPTAVSAAEPTAHRVRRHSVHKQWLLAVWQQWTARSASGRTRLQILAVAVVTLGSICITLEGATVGGRSVVRHGADWVHYAYDRVAGGAAPPSEAAVSVDPVRPATEPPLFLSPPPAPPSIFSSSTTKMCYYTRDVGLVGAIRESQQVFCAGEGTEKRTQLTLIDLEERGIGFRALVFKNELELDFSQAAIAKPIASLANDGGGHDPRFKWDDRTVSCGCDELAPFAKQYFAASNSTTTLRLWDPQFADTPDTQDAPASLCAAAPASLSDATPNATVPVVEIAEKTIIIARRDDHNPFFQISNALNAWLLMKSLGWRREETRVVHMDGGYQSPIDALHHRLLSSPDKFEILRGREQLMGNKFKFTNDVLLAPFEVTGPMMQHLNNREPCGASHLLKEFRAQALLAMDVDASDFDTAHQITVTVITRRDYGGRTVQRRWLNEDDVLAAVRDKYAAHNGVPIVVQSVDFVDLSLQEQMQITLQSDVVIGMHGAGMVNVLWTRPDTLVVEIFPRLRKRWGYRNLCQYVGCDWHQFRGGSDTGKGDNASDKTIPVEEWASFFDPLFGGYLAKIGSSRASPAVGHAGEFKSQRMLRR